MKRILFAAFLLAFMHTSGTFLQAQTVFYEDCFNSDNDLGGILSAGNPDVLTLEPMSGTEEVQTLLGCFEPSNADYNDLFRFHVPAGYVISAIQFGYLGDEFLGTTVSFSLWHGTDCQPSGSPAIHSGGYSNNPDPDTWFANMLPDPLPGDAWYSIRLDMDNWPSSTRYHLHFTFSCDDSEAPEFTTIAGALDAELSCTNAAGLAAALALEPEGEDNSGDVTLELTSDETTPEPGCPNTYTRIRTWTLEDACGNTSASYIQTIEVTDNAQPYFTMSAGTLDVVLDCDDAAGLADALDLEPTGEDACGEVNLLLISDTTTPDPGCSHAYNRVRTWRLADACGNQSLAVFHQSIQVQDNTPPVAVALNGEVAISVAEGYELKPEDVLNLAATHDACGEITIDIEPATVGCELLGQVVPITVSVTDECGNTTEVVAMIEVTEDTGIKAPWDHDNIGGTANGSATHSPCQGVYTVTSSGFSLPSSDVGHFVYVDLCGDGEIIARVASVNPATGWAGVMVRENLQPGARKALLKTGLNNTIRREIRTSTNGVFQMQQSAVLPGPRWLRIARTGNTFNLYTSSNGTDWQFTGSAVINMGNCILMGIYTESTNNNTAVTATFDNVSVSGGIQPLVGSFNPDGVIDVAETATLSPLIYPNPGTGEFKVDLSAFGTSEVWMEVSDLSGHHLFSRQLTAGKTPEALSLAHYPPGMYLIRLQPETGKSHVLKLMLK